MLLFMLFVGERVADDSSIHLHRERGIRGTAVAQLRVLEAFGVSPVAEMVYLAMLEHPADGVSALAEQVGGEILRVCIRYGGSITGEHGVGADKAVYMGELFDDDSLETMNWVRCAFDPGRSFNPGKVFPTPRLCGDVPGVYVAHPSEAHAEIPRG